MLSWIVPSQLCVHHFYFSVFTTVEKQKSTKPQQFKLVAKKLKNMALSIVFIGSLLLFQSSFATPSTLNWYVFFHSNLRLYTHHIIININQFAVIESSMNIMGTKTLNIRRKTLQLMKERLILL